MNLPDGKFDSYLFADENGQIIMNRVNNYLPWLYENTKFYYASLFPQHFSDYILKTPNLSEQYANILVGTLPGQRYEFYTNSNF